MHGSLPIDLFDFNVSCCSHGFFWKEYQNSEKNKTYLCNMMTNERLNHLSTIAIEKKKLISDQLSKNCLVDNFSTKKTCHMEHITYHDKGMSSNKIPSNSVLYISSTGLGFLLFSLSFSKSKYNDGFTWVSYFTWYFLFFC